MPANMMSAPVGSRLAVAGSSSAIVRAGPTPGITPIAVPKVTPTNPHIRLIGVSATAKPAINASKVPMSGSEWAGRQAQAERPGEQEVGRYHQRQPDCKVAHGALASESARDQHEHQDRRDDE